MNLGAFSTSLAVKDIAANSGGGAENTGRMNIELKPLEERKVTVDQVIQAVAKKMGVDRKRLLSTSRERRLTPSVVCSRSTRLFPPAWSPVRNQSF